MPLYLEDKKAILFKGEHKPVSLYLGDKKVTGYEYANAEGEHMEFSGTYNDTASVVINGKSEQVQTEQGKNLIDLTAYNKLILNYNQQDITSQMTNDGVILANRCDLYVGGAYFIPDNQFSLMAGRYILSGKTKDGENAAIWAGIAYTDGTRNVVNVPITLTGDWVSFTYPFTVDEEKTVYGLLLQNNGQKAVSNIKFTQLQLELGSTATEYEPFIPDSPSPDYPSPINSVSNFDLVVTDGAEQIQTPYFPYTLRSLPDGVKDYIEVDDVAKTARLVRHISTADLQAGDTWVLAEAKPNSIIVSTHLKPTQLVGTTLISTEPVSGDFTVQYTLATPIITELNYEAVETYYPYTQIYTTDSDIQPMLEGKFKIRS